jgi:Ca2+-binding RTX toxin-like protein
VQCSALPVQDGRVRVIGGGEVPLGEGALPQGLDLLLVQVHQERFWEGPGDDRAVQELRRNFRWVEVVREPGDDLIDGGPGIDVILADANTVTTGGNDLVIGGPGNDLILGDGCCFDSVGAGGDDTLRGGPGDDSISGDKGDDFLDGGPGMDPLDGGPGTDTCRNGEPEVNCEN